MNIFRYDKGGLTDQAPLVADRITGPDTMFVREPSLIGRLGRMSLSLAALTLLASFDARVANASCGDYVMVGGHHGHDRDHTMPGVPSCHGPNCQNRAPLPALPTKGLVTAPPVDVAIWSQTGRSTRPALCGEIFEPGLLLSEGHSLPLLRPPCL